MSTRRETPKRVRILSLMIAAGLLYAPERALADNGNVPAENEPADAENPAEDPAEDPPKDPMPEVLSYFEEAAEAEEQGRYVAAADLYEAAYVLLDDARKYRNPRSTAISQIYKSLLTAYENANTKTGRLHHACRLRKLMTQYLRELRAGYGEASESFPEVYFGSEKLASLDLMIASYGDPEKLCPTDVHDPVVMLDPESTNKPPVDTISSTDKAAQGPSTDDTQHPIEPARDRKAVAMTAVGGSSIGLGAIALGVMTAYIIQSAERSSDIEQLGEKIAMRGPNPLLTAEEIAYGDRLSREGLLANKIALGTGIGGGIVLVTGVILTAIGRKRMRSNELSLVPNASRTSLGATLSIRF